MGEDRSHAVLRVPRLLVLVSGPCGLLCLVVLPNAGSATSWVSCSRFHRQDLGYGALRCNPCSVQGCCVLGYSCEPGSK